MANLVGRVGSAFARSGEQAGNVAKLVHAAHWAQPRWKWSVDCNDTSIFAGLVPGGAERHGGAAAVASEEDAAWVDIESLLGNSDAIVDSILSGLDRALSLAPAEAAAGVFAFANAARSDGHKIPHADVRHRLPQLALVAGRTMEPDDERIRVARFVVDRGEGCVRSVVCAFKSIARGKHIVEIVVVWGREFGVDVFQDEFNTVHIRLGLGWI